MKIPKGVDRQFFENDSGQLSMMRLQTYHGALLGRAVALAGLVILVLELFVFTTGTVTGLTVTGLGIAMFGIGEGAKAAQSAVEHRK